MGEKTGKKQTIFTRTSLVEQVAAGLRASLAEGAWEGHLPPERRLCELTKVSRPILRAAIHCLEKDGFVKIRPGRPSEIIRQKKPPGIRDPGNKKVVLLLGDPGNHISEWTIRAIDELRRELQERGFRFDSVFSQSLRRKNPTASLRRLVEQYDAHCWILGGVPFSVQHWFQNNHLKAVVMGNRFPEIRLPFVNDDQEAVARHAAGVLLGLGHKKVAFFERETGTAGEEILEAGFVSSFRGRQGVSSVTIKHPGDVKQLRAALQRVFLEGERPTSVVVSHALDALVVIVWFLENGITIPRDVSLISLQWESFLGRMLPLPAWYESDPGKHAQKLCRLATMSTAGSQSAKPLFPEFVKNDSLAPPGQGVM